MSPSRTIVALAAAAGLAAVPAIPTSDPTADLDLTVADALCAADLGDAASLVTDLVAETPVRARAAGVDIAVVLDPLVPPGIPTALLDTSSGLCTVETFNLTLAPALGSAGTVASVFASTAGMPWLGDVEVRDLAVDGDTVTLTTFGGRHNVTSEWTVVVDALGVRDASFETIAFGTGLTVADEAELEGVTSRPGHGRSWTRSPAGLLDINATIRDDLAASIAERDAAAANAASAAGLAPGDFLEFTGEDGQVVRITLGVAATGVETVPTGVPQADRLTHLRDGLFEIYKDAESWGLVDPWDNTSRTYFSFPTMVPDTAGYVNISSGVSAYCLACAFLADVIEIHAEYAFPEIAQELVNVSYPDPEDFFVDVMGHELVHSMQGGYGNGSVGLANSFTEATARAAEALFDGAQNTFQPNSIAYVNNINGCEGFENGAGNWLDAQAAGPFLNGHSYDSCYLWWTYYAEHGGPGLIRLLEAQPQVRGVGQDTADRNILLLDLASPTGDGTVDLARWAAAYTAGSDADGYTIVDGDGDVHDWFALLSEADRSRNLTTTQSVSLGNGGTAGFTVGRNATLRLLPDGVEAFLFEVVDGDLVLAGPAVVGDPVGIGQILSVVAPDGGDYSGVVAIG